MLLLTSFTFTIYVTDNRFYITIMDRTRDNTRKCLVIHLYLFSSKYTLNETSYENNSEGVQVIFKMNIDFCIYVTIYKVQPWKACIMDSCC